jgi:sulfate adenylyltransferase subunit 1 (EFTu-like GTPase family)
VLLRTAVPLMTDPYKRNRTTGSFILIDEFSNATVGAGMILWPEPAERAASGQFADMGGL